MFYIKGNKVRGSEVIALLESKGGKGTCCEGTSENCYYYLDKNNNIRVTSEIMAKTAIEYLCEELTLPEEWKPKYKIAAEVQTVNTHQKGTIIFIDSTDKSYQVSFADSTQFWFKENEIEPYKWTPKRGETILVRDTDLDYWEEAVYSFYMQDSPFPYRIVGGLGYTDCIQFDESKLGKITEN